MLIETPETFLYSEVLGDLSDDILLVLHGGPGAGFDYLRPQLDKLKDLKKKSCLFYYDQRGTKRSQPKNPLASLDHQAHINDLEYLQQNIFDQRKISLVGYSWGSLLAILYALKNKNCVEKMLLISPAPTQYSYRVETKQRLEQSFYRPEVQMMKDYLARHQDSWNQETIAKYRFSIAVSGYFYDPQQALKMTPFKVQKNVEDAVWNGLGFFDISNEIKQLKDIPTLIIHGKQDVIPIQSAYETAHNLQAIIETFDLCGHVPFIEAQHQTFEICKQFLKDC